MMGRRCILTEQGGNPLSNITSHISDILNIANDTNKPKGNQQGKRRRSQDSGVCSQPGKHACFDLEGEKRHLGGHGKHVDDGDDATDDAHDKGRHQRHLVAANRGRLMLFDVLDGIQTLVERGHKSLAIVEMRFLGEEKILYGFVFVHSFSFSFSWSRPRESCFFTASSDGIVHRTRLL